MQLGRFAGIILLLFSLFALRGADAASSFRPLEIGYFQEFDGIAGQHEAKAVVRNTMVFGNATSVVEYYDSDLNDGLENYWSVSPEGHVLLWGYFRRNDGFGQVYYPPIRMVDDPPYEGKTWTTHFRVYSLPDTILVNEGDLAFEVYEEGEVSVPAGTFYAYGIGRADSFSSLQNIHPGFEITGRRSDEVQPRSADKWWARGVGEVQYLTTDLYQLTNYGMPTPSRRSSFGHIKWLFHGNR